jgi:Transposase
MRWKSHVRFGGRSGETHPPKDRQGAPARSHVANRCLDQVRRRVQNETLGHRGRKRDPLYRIRKLLLTGNERLDDRGRDRMLLGLRVGDPHDEVLGAWLAN